MEVSKKQQTEKNETIGKRGITTKTGLLRVATHLNKGEIGKDIRALKGEKKFLI